MLTIHYFCVSISTKGVILLGIGKRIKEARERLGMSRIQLAAGLGVTVSAVSNYENDISGPKEQVMYKLLEILSVDANYLFQDEMKKLIYKDKAILELEEYPVIVKYRRLNDSGKEYIHAQLDFALSQEKYKGKLPLIGGQGIQAETEPEESDFVDVSYAAYGGDSGTFQISREQFNEAKKLFDEYDYRTDK